tara:strand:+ start:436 stop:633 length:198 start_codon:yes stop_codon:yes gene_type:complete
MNQPPNKNTFLTDADKLHIQERIEWFKIKIECYKRFYRKDYSYLGRFLYSLEDYVRFRYISGDPL